MKIKILDAATLGEDIDLSSITSMGDVMVYDRTPADMVEERISDAEVIVLNKIKVSGDNLSGAKNLKLICITATGYDNVDVDYCRKRGIAVCNVCGYSTDSVAQLTVAAALSLVMHIREYSEYVCDGSYTKSGVQNYLKPAFHELSALTWGIAGYGNIGKRVSEVAKALGSKVIAYKRTPTDGVQCVDIDTLCRESDIISVHLPLNSDTQKLINKERLEMMKPSAILVNVARGAVIDEAAVRDAIINKSIGGFATDVYSVEPLQEDSPLRDLLGYENVLFTPHMAWGAFESRMRCMDEIRKNIEAFFRGEIRNRVDL